MNDVSIVIPYGTLTNDVIRNGLFDYVKSWWSFNFPESPIITAESYNEDGSFNRSESRNIAVSKVDTRFLVIADADTICPAEALIEAFDRIRSRIPYASWVLPYGPQNYYNLTKEFTDSIISNGPNADIPQEKELVYDHKLQSWAGVLCMSKAGFEKVGGYDNNFIGWGYEDNAFRLALDTLWAQHERVESYCVHLWHPASEDERFNQPHIYHNRRLYEKYTAAYGNRLAMRSLKGI